MCGFFAFSTGMSAKQIADLFELTNMPKNEKDIQSIKFYPKSLIPTVSKNSPNKLVMRYWSLIPRWWKEDPRKIKFSTFNARVEDIATKPTYRSAWSHHQRCLIPATWFYEFQTLEVVGKPKAKKIPYKVEIEGEEVIGLAGLYETWTNGRQTVESCTIITCPAVASLKIIHNRQPVILTKDQWESWLNPAATYNDITALLHPTIQLSPSKISSDFFRTISE